MTSVSTEGTRTLDSSSPRKRVGSSHHGVVVIVQLVGRCFYLCRDIWCIGLYPVRYYHLRKSQRSHCEGFLCLMLSSPGLSLCWWLNQRSCPFSGHVRSEWGRNICLTQASLPQLRYREQWKGSILPTLFPTFSTIRTSPLPLIQLFFWTSFWNMLQWTSLKLGCWGQLTRLSL